MPPLRDLSQRRGPAVPEILEDIDSSSLEAKEHRRILAARARTHAWSGTARMLWPEIARVAWDLGRDALGEPTARSLRHLDVGCGAGDVPIALWRRAQRRGVRLSVQGCDPSALAVECAGEQARAHGADVRFFQCDLAELPAENPFNIVTCTNLLHRLEHGESIALLERLSAIARHLLLVSDYERCQAGHAMAWVGTRFSSRIARSDTLRSVESAFRLDEVIELAKAAGMKSPRIERRFPFRWLLVENKSEKAG